MSSLLKSIIKYGKIMGKNNEVWESLEMETAMEI